MPIYEYVCSNCGHEFEAMRKISAPPLTECPECGQNTVTKQISKVAFRLKGTGWYETDFKDKAKSNVHTGDDDKGSASSSNNEKSAKESSSGSADSSAKSSSSADSKPKKSSSTDD